jgi:hypothetical protein
MTFEIGLQKTCSKSHQRKQNGTVVSISSPAKCAKLMLVRNITSLLIVETKVWSMNCSRREAII